MGVLAGGRACSTGARHYVSNILAELLATGG